MKTNSGRKTVEMRGEAIVLQMETCRYEIGRDGRSRAFVDLATGRDYLEAGHPFMVIGRGTQTWPSSQVEREEDVLTVSFGPCEVQVRARIDSYRQYFTLTLEEVSGGEVDWVQLSNLQLKITENVGTLVNVAWNNDFAACVLACTDFTHSYGEGGTETLLGARCYREFGQEGAKIAVIGVPTGGPDPAARLLDAIEVVELEQGLSHPMLHSVWIKRAPERFYSYLMAVGVSEDNIDQVIEFARGGFGCVEIVNWWNSTPTYAPHPELFPHGIEGLKKVAGKIHAAGLNLGLHVMQGMVGWGGVGLKDPCVSPKADPRLLQDRRVTLAAAIGPKTTELSVQENMTDWPEQGDFYLEGEIIRYTGRTDTGFTGCQRGLHETTIIPPSARRGDRAPGQLLRPVGRLHLRAGYPLYSDRRDLRQHRPGVQ